MFGRKKNNTQEFNIQEFISTWFYAQKLDRAERAKEEREAEMQQKTEMEDALKAKRAQYEQGMRYFIDNYTPEQIEEKLTQYIVGQPELVRDTADFLYYHAMRQVLPNLPIRPMMIAGPSGSGKTEVWRVIKRLYGQYFKIKIVDGSKMTNDGWSGSYKLVDVFDEEMLRFGGILVVDEFDKLAKPRHSASGDNVAAEMQYEFLKILEGEGEIMKDRKVKLPVDTRKMGFVFVGAFADLTEDLKKKKANNKIGFGHQANVDDIQINEITDDEYIDYGVVAEIVGRVSTKTVTRELTDDDYINIIYNPNSRVMAMKQSLKHAGIVVPEISNEEILELINTTKRNKTGVRWVSAQIENKILQNIRKTGMGAKKKKEEEASLFDLIRLVREMNETEEKPER